MAVAPLFYDVLLDDDGDLPEFTRHVRGVEAIMQRIRIRLATHKGEWVLDVRKGLPYMDWLQTKPVPLGEIGALVRREMETTPGVVRVDDFEIDFDGDAEEVTISCVIQTEEGEVDATVSPMGVAGNRVPHLLWFMASGTIAP